MHYDEKVCENGCEIQEAIDKCTDAFADFGNAILKLADGMGDLMADLVEILSKNTSHYLGYVAAYRMAADEHPEWVRRARCSKKKHIRKKYHDRIMRQYRKLVL